MRTSQFKNRRILITAGPTWVPIDNVRVISNTASAETGILLAEKLLRLGAKVTLLLGPASACCLKKKIKLIRFRFFDELKEKILRELNTGVYDILIHTAAVSDYRPKRVFMNKVTSGKKEWCLKLVPTVKIIDLIKRLNRHLLIIGFKFKPQCRKEILIREAKGLIRRSRIDIVVANTVCNQRYRAFIVDANQCRGQFSNKNGMCEGLIRIMGDKTWKM